jgi:hypothetical protein
MGLDGGSSYTTSTNTSSVSVQSQISKEDAGKQLKDLMDTAMKANIVSSYEFSESKNVVYAGKGWYTQKVSFKKDFLAKLSSLKQVATGYRHFEVRDAYSDEKIAEVTAFGGSLEVYK